jgi:glycerol-3-phosphate dehydrogenase
VKKSATLFSAVLLSSQPSTSLRLITPMKRDCGRLQNKCFDLLIIGGGVHGAAAARRLATAGYDVALVEKGDFCQATSANSLKILHGGLRYLQHADFRRMRESIRARREFMQLAPHLVQPLTCLMPTKGYGIKGKLAMGAALLFNDVISFDRNKGLEKDKHLGRGRILAQKKAKQIISGLTNSSITGAALWYDTLLLNSERMVLLLLHQAVAAGAVVGNYLRAESVSTDDAQQEVTVWDVLGKKSFVIKSKMIINCAGPWVDGLIPSGTVERETMALAKAVNIVVDRSYFGKYAVGLEGSSEYKDKDMVVQRGKRLFFFVPWRGKTMIGTTYCLSDLANAPLLSSKDDIREMIAEVNGLYPAANLSVKDVVFSHVGLVPAYSAEAEDRKNDPRLLKHSEIIEQQNGILSVRGVKYTTALQLARDLETLLRQKSPPVVKPKVDKETVGMKSKAEMDASFIERFPHLYEQYGDQSERICQIMKDEPESQALLSSEPVLSVAEVLYGIREEMAFHLTDIVLRRTELGSCGSPEGSVLNSVAEVMAKELLWTPEQCKEEFIAMEQIYQQMNVRLP